MRSGIIENAEELKLLYLNTDITDVSAVQTAQKVISENVYVAGKEKYIEALKTATPANIAKARKYNKIATGNGIKPLILKNLGWIIMAIFAIWMGAQVWEDDSTWQSLGFWAGAGIQIYIAVLKNAWSKLTLSGSVLHSALKEVAVQSAVTNGAATMRTTQTVEVQVDKKDATQYVFCSQCGRRNKADTQFCESCGAKL